MPDTACGLFLTWEYAQVCLVCAVVYGVTENLYGPKENQPVRAPRARLSLASWNAWPGLGSIGLSPLACQDTQPATED